MPLICNLCKKNYFIAHNCSLPEGLTYMDHECHPLMEEIEQLKAERDKLRGLLRRVEWGLNRVCPRCGEYAVGELLDSYGTRSKGHAKDCELAEALGDE